MAAPVVQPGEIVIPLGTWPQPDRPETHRLQIAALEHHDQYFYPWTPHYQIIQWLAKKAHVRVVTHCDVIEWLRHQAPKKRYRFRGQLPETKIFCKWDEYSDYKDFPVTPLWVPNHHLSARRFTLYGCRDVIAWFSDLRKEWRCLQCGRRSVWPRQRCFDEERPKRYYFDSTIDNDWRRYETWWESGKSHFGWVCSRRCEQQRDKTWQKLKEARSQLKSVRRWLAQPKTRRDASVSPTAASKPRQTSPSL